MKISFIRQNTWLALLFIVGILSSCSSAKYLPYLEDLKELDGDSILSIVSPEVIPKIAPRDILIVNVGGSTPEAVSIFNKPMVGRSTTSSIGASTTQEGLTQNAARQVLGYMVDENGRIDFPVIGQINVGGLTLNQAENEIKKQLSTLIETPLVDVRYLNFEVSVIGEVGHPGTFSIPDSRITLLEALSKAGDITLFGRRNNIMVIRQDGDRKIVGRINLKNSDNFFHSPYYYLQQNDVVYVEPKRSAVWNRDNAAIRNASTVLSILSTAAVLISIFK